MKSKRILQGNFAFRRSIMTVSTNREVASRTEQQEACSQCADYPQVSNLDAFLLLGFLDQIPKTGEA